MEIREWKKKKERQTCAMDGRQGKSHSEKKIQIAILLVKKEANDSKYILNPEIRAKEHS